MEGVKESEERKKLCRSVSTERENNSEEHRIKHLRCLGVRLLCDRKWKGL